MRKHARAERSREPGHGPRSSSTLRGTGSIRREINSIGAYLAVRWPNAKWPAGPERHGANLPHALTPHRTATGRSSYESSVTLSVRSCGVKHERRAGRRRCKPYYT
eukprot:4192305-Prymnesium_polylepis.1